MSNVAQGANQIAGDGQLLIDLWVSGAKTKAARFAGDVSKADLTPNVNEIETYTHSDGTRTLLNSAVTRQKWEFSCELTEFTKDNLALFFMGDASSPYTQTGGTITAEAHPEVALNGLDRFYRTTNRAISAVTVKGGATGTTLLAAGTDYIITDYGMGVIYFPSTSTFVPSTDTIKIDYTAAPITGTGYPRVRGGTTNSQFCTLIFRPTPMSGVKWEHTLWKVRLRGDGAFPWITDEFGKYTLKGLLMNDGSNTGLWESVQLP